jgi:hypothetical protein
MNWKTVTIGAMLIAVAAISTSIPAVAQTTATTQPTNNCDSGDKIDNSTANDARQKLEAAGYTDVAGLNKGCDNVWHGQARTGGNLVNVMVAPDGSVHQETN